MAGQPLYHTLYLSFRSQIHDGQYAPGDMLPGEIELAKQYKCSRVTVRKALEQLALNGLVERQQGRGTIVQGGRAAEPVRAEVTGFVENLLAMGLRTNVQVLHFAFEVPPARIRAELGLGPNEQALHTIRLRFYKDQPFSYSVAWVPESIGQSFSRSELAAQPLTQLFRKAGINVARADQRVFAAAASAVIAPLLDLDVGSPVLGIERRVEDAGGRVVEHLRVFYHPERYEFEISMHADTANGGVWKAE